MKTFSLEVHTESGEMPSSSAAARSNALNDEPGWRWPCGGEVERAFVVVAPADHRAHLAGRVFDRDQRRGRAGRVGEVVVDRLFGRALEFQIERRGDLQAAVEGARGAVAFDHLLLHPAGEVAGVDAFDGLLLRGLDLRGEGSAWLTLWSYTDLAQVALVEHLAQDDFAPLLGGDGMLGGVVGGGRLDDARQQRRLPRLELFDAQFVAGQCRSRGG